MSLYLDMKYIGFISSQLKRFSRKSEKLWQFRCPYCMDSQKNERKARGYIYEQRDMLFFRCHNCGYGTTFANFLKFINQQCYNDYIMEKFSSGEMSSRKINDDKKPSIESFEAPKIKKLELNLPNIKELPDTNEAVIYLKQRKIPEQHMQLFYYAEDYQVWANEFTKGTLKEKYKTAEKDPRIVIPFLDTNGKLIATQARSLNPDNKLRYVTIKIDTDVPKIFGLERWNPLQKTYITEGPIDSLFLPNCLAMAGSSVDVDNLFQDKSRVVFVYDNEKRNYEIVRLMLKAINKGYSICIWSDLVVEKDINDMILNGKSMKQVKELIDTNTKSGLAATLAIASWRKC